MSMFRLSWFCTGSLEMRAYKKHPGSKSGINKRTWEQYEIDEWLSHYYHQNPAVFMATQNKVLGRRLVNRESVYSSFVV